MCLTFQLGALRYNIIEVRHQPICSQPVAFLRFKLIVERVGAGGLGWVSIVTLDKVEGSMP